MTRRFVIAVAILSLVGCERPSAATSGSLYLATNNGAVEFQFPAGWQRSGTKNPYDLHCKSQDEQLTMGVFLFAKSQLEKNLTYQELLELQIEDLRSKRQKFNLLEQKQSVSLDKKKLTTVVYSGEKDSESFYYRLTLIEFTDHPEMPLIVLQVALPENWALHKPILDEITKSARIPPLPAAQSKG